MEAITRKEKFLAKAAGQDIETPTPITREEIFLSKIGAGGGGTSGGGGAFVLRPTVEEIQIEDRYNINCNTNFIF